MNYSNNQILNIKNPYLIKYTEKLWYLKSCLRKGPGTIIKVYIHTNFQDYENNYSFELEFKDGTTELRFINSEDMILYENLTEIEKRLYG